jgi:hypothetical protein
MQMVTTFATLENVHKQKNGGNVKKKRSFIYISILTVMAIMLSACAATTSTTTEAATYSSRLSTATQLAAGTLKLEGADQAITSSQAGELLTLWQAYQSLSNSDITSQVEEDALVNQIEGAMTSEQLKAIDDMNLSEQTLSEIMQSSAVNDPASLPASTSGSSTSSGQNTPQDGPGGMPGGPGGDSIMSQIDGSGTTTQSTPVVTQSIDNMASPQVSPMILQALIQMLKALSQATG